MTRLVCIDGNAILHRAYHALPPLTTKDGTLVNAVYGFTSMLLKIWKDLEPTHVCVAFDRPTPTFRKELFKAYQAKRPKMDDELIPQVDKVHEVVRAFGIPIFEVDGFEADDVIGSLCKKFQDEKTDEIIVVTGDRDLLQLVNDRVKVYMPVKGLSEATLFGKKEAKEKLGVDPKQIPDYKALAGDASDNYPGVVGIGPKTAVKLLSTYKTLDNVLTSQKFSRAERESAELSKQLATIRTDVPLDVSSIHPLSTLDTPESRKALGEFGFKSLLRRLTEPSKEQLSLV